MTINNVFLLFRAPKPWPLVRQTAAATQHKTKQNISNQQHEQLVVQPFACTRVVFLVDTLMVVVVQDELKITLDLCALYKNTIRANYVVRRPPICMNGCREADVLLFLRVEGAPINISAARYRSIGEPDMHQHPCTAHCVCITGSSRLGPFGIVAA
jgi:hypothetical protein